MGLELRPLYPTKAGVATEDQSLGGSGLKGSFIVQSRDENPFAAATQNWVATLTNPGATMLRRPILSPQEWLNDTYYSGPLGSEYWPQKKADFYEAAQGIYNEIIFTGAISTGKSALVKGVFKYDIYRYSCFADPQKYLGVSAIETMTMILVMTSVTKANDKLYGPLRRSIEMTPYFRDHFMFNPRIEKTMEFPNSLRVRAGVTGESAIHGEDVLSLAVSEANFLPKIDSSRRNRGQMLDVAANLIEAFERRLVSRFGRADGIIPLGRIIVDSSRNYPDDYGERRIERILSGKMRHKAIVVSRAIWEAKRGARDESGNLLYSGDTFPVEVGTDSRMSRILTPAEVPFATGRVVNCAVEHRSDFETDIEGALRDFAGEAVLTIHPLITNRETVPSAVRSEEQGYAEYECIHPWASPSTTFYDGVAFLDELLYDANLKCPRVRPEMPRTVHIDMSLTGDHLGFAMGHMECMTMTPSHSESQRQKLPCVDCNGEGFLACAPCNGSGRRRVNGARIQCVWCNGTKTQMCKSCNGTGLRGMPIETPRVYIDFCLEVLPPQNRQIQFEDLTGLLKRLRLLGFNIPVVTADGWQSAYFLQRQANEFGATIAEVLSLDRSKDGYLALRGMLMQPDIHDRQRISFPAHATLQRELLSVENRRDKIDHPPGGSKDVADAVAGVAFNITRFPLLQESIEVGNNLSVSVFRHGREITDTKRRRR